MTPAILQHLKNIRKTSDGWEACCPAHEDNRQSLSVAIGDDGRTLLHCHVSCTPEAIVAAAGLSMRDLFPTHDQGSNGKPTIVAVYDYRDEEDRLLFQVCRFEPKDFRQRRPKDGGGWDWKLNGCRRVLYRLAQLRNASPAAPVFVCEGEKDVDLLIKLGAIATTNAGGAGKWQAAYGRELSGRHVAILPDNDDPGRKHARQVAASLVGIAASIKIVELPGLPPKGDVTDFIRPAGALVDEAMRFGKLIELWEAAAEWTADDPADPAADGPGNQQPVISAVSIGSLIRDFPKLLDPVIDGLLRRTETANIIAPPKFGKSWLAYSLIFSVITQADWLGQFPCVPGKVLLIDNELHPATLAHRIAWVAKALGLKPKQFEHDIDVLALRGRLMDLHAIARTIEKIESGVYSLVILDAFYRSLPQGVSENDNTSVMQLYNAIDHTAGHMDTAWANIHHASKGNQSSKEVTDIGAGAGSQSRAADAHIVLRPHEEEGVVVLEAAVRSFKPVAPVALRFEFPLWVPASGVETSLLKGKRTIQEEKQDARDKEGINAIVDALQHAQGPLSTREIRDETGMGPDRVGRLLAKLVRDDQLHRQRTKISGHDSMIYTLPAEGLD